MDATGSHTAAQNVNEKTTIYASGGIEALGDEARPIDPGIERRVLRKIDLFLMPAMVIGYGLVYYDKAILGSAALFGMTADLQLSVTDTSVTPPVTDTSRLSWATSIFYFGQLAGSYPMTYLLQYFKTRYVLGPSVILWAIVCAATAGVTSWRGLLALRFFLGFTEAIIPTGFMVTVSGYYTQREQSLRQSWWWSGTGWFTIIGGGFNYGFAQIKGGALKPWQYIYVFAGVLTFLFGIWCFFLPNDPLHAWFLTPEERIVAVERLRASQLGVKSHELKKGQIKEALLDVRIWLIALTMAAAYHPLLLTQLDYSYTVNGAVSGFGPLIVATFGYSSLQAILFQFPLGAISGVGIVLTGWICSRIRNIRIILLVSCCLPVIAGFVMIWKSSWGHKPVTPVAGYSLIGFFGPVVGLTISLGASNVTGETKKSFMASAIFVAYCVGNIVGPQLIKSQQKADHYPELWTGLIICYCITIASASTLAVLWYCENKRRAALDLDESERDRLAFKDLTDCENLHFRYVY
ncbi:MFS general substrate transporter [Aspergillus japonicus CBS 114.51]|uniref:MFS general substrate transporter n=2 Tax=Aspergillus TaxID=5052 RepID=A0A2V5HCR1_ASPV1|nr:MFS general substrate transporter [Aspergillus japonicus CBS 114.51]PYI19604.1 MFS general substrate transporter [Aspergillus violaceofuscus CBS 115571]RAH81969.1 MFS general substrate transporter [Aspergillus japonicus CBS 114.51]